MSLDWFLGPMSLTVRWLLCSLCVLGSLVLIARVVEIPAPPLWVETTSLVVVER
jgi:hypothetical protein